MCLLQIGALGLSLGLTFLFAGWIWKKLDPHAEEKRQVAFTELAQVKQHAQKTAKSALLVFWNTCLRNLVSRSEPFMPSQMQSNAKKQEIFKRMGRSFETTSLEDVRRSQLGLISQVGCSPCLGEPTPACLPPAFRRCCSASPPACVCRSSWDTSCDRSSSVPPWPTSGACRT